MVYRSTIIIIMRTVTEMLELLREDFLKQLENQCGIFKTIGTKEESPRWFQYRIDKNEKGILFIGHSQCNYMWIKLDITAFTEDEQFILSEGCNFQDVYDYFKELKYDYLRNNQPTITI